jgi:hypothetical protein
VILRLRISTSFLNRACRFRHSSSLGSSWTLPYPHRFLVHNLERTVNEARLRQLSLLNAKSNKPIPKEIEAKAIELLAQLLISVISAIDGGKRDEQNHE